MATKPAKASDTDVEELLDTLDKTLDRLKTLYEQYFLGIQKQAPSFIHNDVERKIRDLTQMNLRNTGVRYRLATLTQKFGSYNSYWRRTLRQIENGTYARQLQKVGRDAVRSGVDVPEEILAAMPKRMREQVVRDREAAVAIARRRQAADEDARLAATGGAGLPPEADDDFIAMIKEPTELRRKLKGTDGSHLLDDVEGDFDIDAFFAEVEQKSDDKPARRASGITTPPSSKAAASPPRGDVASTPPPTRPASGADRPRSTTRNDLVRQGTAPPPSGQIGGGQAPTVPGRAGPPPVPARVTGAPSPPQPPGRGATMAMPILTPRSTAVPTVPAAAAGTPGTTSGRVSAPMSSTASSQATRPLPFVPGSAAARGPVPVESMQGPFPRERLATPPGGIPTIPRPGTLPAMPPIAPLPPLGAPLRPGVPRPIIPSGAETQPLPVVVRSPVTPAGGVPAPAKPRPEPAVIVTKTPAATIPSIRPATSMPAKPPPGMTDADVNALYAKYVKAKEMVGEKVGPGEHGKLLKTINAQAPKIMEQYKANGVDFSVVVKDNQVIIRAKPKT